MIHASPSGRGWSARRPSACARNTTQHYCSRRRLLEPRCHSLSNNNKMHWAGYTPTVGRTSHIARAGQTHETRHTRRRHDSQRTDMIAATHDTVKKIECGRVTPSRVAPAVPSTPCPPHPLRKKKRGSPSLFSDTQSSGHAHQRIIRLLRERGSSITTTHTRTQRSSAHKHNVLVHSCFWHIFPFIVLHSDSQILSILYFASCFKFLLFIWPVLHPSLS